MIVSAGWTTLAGSLAVVLITLWLIGRAAPEESTDSVVSRLYRVRGRYFVVLSVVLIAVMVWGANSYSSHKLDEFHSLVMLPLSATIER